MNLVRAGSNPVLLPLALLEQLAERGAIVSASVSYAEGCRFKSGRSDGSLIPDGAIGSTRPFDGCDPGSNPGPGMIEISNLEFEILDADKVGSVARAAKPPRCNRGAP